MSDTGSVLINGLSIGGGGGLTVGVELTRALAHARPDWTVRLLLTENHPLHEEALHADWPENAELIWADPATQQRRPRDAYERTELPELVRARNADSLVQLNGMMPAGNPAIDAPIICHHQDPWPYRPQAWLSWKHRVIAFLKRRRHRNALRKADWLTFTSNYLLQTITQHHRYPTDRCSVLANGLPDAMIRLARTGPAQEAEEDRADEILTVSNVSPYKQQWRVIDALAELTRRGHKDVIYRVIGGGDERDLTALRERARQLGIARRVRVEGRVDEARVVWAYERARVFALHSQCESFGIPAIEAMAYGVPVVVADCCALPEVTDNAALHADPDNTTALADAIERLLTDEDLSADLAARGRERVEQFKWSDSGQQLATLIEQLTRN
ncbi:glycosyltransferase family 4 protein [Mucisphaera calidilacus]|uniref:D-inositol 3-phosphate glycosyltransferase n=1 Tax=Mucisphaera calidilacus TaxID=2527982 RepID=A0A518C0G2_9BACT|nr:glycosyltransferase family 1 protein [Mucisphaera calidilacus]QDU72721.1 D-inositol 3-phosphate glycosyltransferase [Mucisphaera calidilacus]